MSPSLARALLLLAITLVARATPALSPPLPPRALEVIEAANSWDDDAGAEARLCALIDATRRTLCGSLYELGLPAVTGSLLRARMRGVEVHLHFERDNLSSSRQRHAMRLLAQSGCRLTADHRSALMHSKLLVADSRWVWCGAVNPTWAGCHVHHNECVLIDDPSAARAFAGYVATLAADRSPPPAAHLTLIDGNHLDLAFDGQRDRLDLALGAVQAARQRIDVLAFSLTHPALIRALCERALHGVRVRICLDERLARGTTATRAARTLARAGCELLTPGRRLAAGIGQRFALPPGQDVKLHYKAMLIDGCTAITGSANFSAAGMHSNDDNVMAITGPAAQAYASLMEKEMRAACPFPVATDPEREARTSQAQADTFPTQPDTRGELTE